MIKKIKEAMLDCCNYTGSDSVEYVEQYLREEIEPLLEQLQREAFESGAKAVDFSICKSLGEQYEQIEKGFNDYLSSKSKGGRVIKARITDLITLETGTSTTTAKYVDRGEEFFLISPAELEQRDKEIAERAWSAARLPDASSDAPFRNVFYSLKHKSFDDYWQQVKGEYE